MSFVRICIHAVWGTKERAPFLLNNIKYKVINHIKENAKNKGIYIDTIDGAKDHLHCVISLNPDQSISKVMNLIKGESSFWINKNKMIKTKFDWADEYFAVSVSESQIGQIREYIRNQEEHHRKKTWHEEYNSFMDKYGFKKMLG